MLRSYRVTEFGAPLTEDIADLPVPKGREVLLAVDACGVCHSDLHLWDGYWDLGQGKHLPFGTGRGIPPITLGHEIVGKVSAVGPEVGADEARIGDRRVVFPWLGCGTCALCRTGFEHICQGAARAIGVFADGGYASHVLVEDVRALVDPGPIPDHLAATYACSGLTAYAALARLGRLEADQPLLIVGAGGVGLNAIRLAGLVTGQAPIVAETNPERRAAALAAGAREAIDPTAEGAARALVKSTGGISAAIDFVGAAASADFAQGVLRKGGHLVVVGLYGGALTLSLPLLVMKAIRIEGSYVGSLAELRALFALAAEAALPPLPVTTRPLAEASAALADLKAGRVVGRQMLVP